MSALFDMTANNVQFTNNLLYNTRAYGQSTYDISGWGVLWPGGKGQLETRNRSMNGGVSSGTYEMGDGTIVDMSNRNIHYGNNVMVWSDGLIDWMNMMADNPWSWEGTSQGELTTFTDTMFYAEDQLVVHSDTTLHLLDRNVGVTSSNNEILSDHDVDAN